MLMDILHLQARRQAHVWGRWMAMDDKKLLALAKRNAAKAMKPPPPPRRYDPTLPPEPAADSEDLKKFFIEM